MSLIYVCDFATPLFPAWVLWKSITLCIHHDLGIILSMFLFFGCFPTFVCQLVAKLRLCIGVLQCTMLLVIFQAIPSSGCSEKQILVPRPFLGLGQSVVTRRTKRSHFILFCSTLECHTLIYQEVELSLTTYLMKWCSYISLSTYPLSYLCSRMLGARIDVAIGYP